MVAHESFTQSPAVAACWQACAEPMVDPRINAVAVFLGWQDDFNGGRIALYNLTHEIPGHPAGSTLSRQTIERALFGAKYGSAVLPKAEDFNHVEGGR